MKVFLLELNEFNEDLLRSAAQEFGLQNIQKLVQMHRTETFTDDTYESDYLEPWVQWVSVHTGHPSVCHQIKHLGDVPHLGMPQIWESLSEMGKTSGVWGAMNASRATAERCRFFLPDPWTASERAYPEELNRLLDPVRHASKNYLGSIKRKIAGQVLDIIKLFYSYGLAKQILKEIPTLIKQIFRFKGANFVFIAFAEYLSARLFLQCKKKHKPDFSLLFINTLAHIQHHYWNGFDYRSNKKLQLGLEYLDRVLGLIYASLEPDEILLVANALSQKNTNEEKPWILYRPIDHRSLLNQAGIPAVKIEPLMTHDAHLFFNSEEECKAAAKQLDAATLMDEKFFLTETYPEDPKKLFYRIVFTDAVPSHAKLLINQRSIPFFEFYKQIVERTGKHIPNGTLFSSAPAMPAQIKNHETFQYILQLFNSESLAMEAK